MTTSAQLLLVAANIVFWVGGFFAVRALLRHVRKLAEPFELPAPLQRYGFEFSIGRCTEYASKNYSHEWIEYSVAMPGVLADLGLIDGNAFHLRTETLAPNESIAVFGAPETDDEVFNGVFDYTRQPSHEVREALDSADVRRLLLQISEGLGGVWVDEGTLRVAQKSQSRTPGGNADERDVDLEAIAGILAQLQEALDPVVFDSGEEQEASEVSVSAQAEGEW